MEKTYRVDATVFDLDGTLLSIEHGLLFAQRVFKELKYPSPDWTRVRRLWGTPWRPLLDLVAPEADYESVQRKWRELEAAEGCAWPAIPGASVVLRELRRRGLPIVLHTNRSTHQRLDERLRDADLPRGLFTFIHTPEDGVAKPHPDALRGVLTRLNGHGCISPDRVVIVSDQTQDADMTFTCGCRFIGVCTGAAAEEDFAPYKDRGAIVVPSITDVPDILCTL